MEGPDKNAFLREQQVLEGLRGTGNTESVVLKTLGVGVLFGELMLLHDAPWSYDFWVAEETRCWDVSYESLGKFTQVGPRTALNECLMARFVDQRCEIW